MYDPRFRRRLRKRRQHFTGDTHPPRTPFRLWFEFLLVLFSWTWLVYILLMIDPSWVADLPFTNSYGPFVGALAAAIGTLCFLVTRHLRWSLMVSVGVGVVTWLRVNHLDSWFHLSLLLGLFGVIEYLWSLSRKPKETPWLWYNLPGVYEKHTLLLNHHTTVC